MKNLILIIGLLSFILSSCGNKVKDAIIEHEQNFFETQVDLNIKFNKLEKIKEITSRDSFLFYTEMLSQVDNIEEAKSSAQQLIDTYPTWETSTQEIKHLKDAYNMALVFMSAADAVDRFNDSDEIIGYEYEAEYTAKNPILNVNQTIKSKYVIDVSESKVLSKERIGLQ